MLSLDRIKVAFLPLLCLALISPALFGASCGKLPPSTAAAVPETVSGSTAAPVDDPRDYEVYSALIEQKAYINHGGEGPRVATLVVIDEETAGGLMPGGTEGSKQLEQEKKYLSEKLKLYSDDLFKNYLTANQKRYRLERKLNVKIEYRFYTDKDQEALHQGNDLRKFWTEFYLRFPGSSGIVTFSRVGYSPDGNTAMVYVGNSCGGLCGTGYDIILVKENGNWKIKEGVMLWIS